MTAAGFPRPLPKKQFCNKLKDTELIDLIREFVESGSNSAFMENRLLI